MVQNEQKTEVQLKEGSRSTKPLLETPIVHNKNGARSICSKNKLLPIQ